MGYGKRTLPRSTQLRAAPTLLSQGRKVKKLPVDLQWLKGNKKSGPKARSWWRISRLILFALLPVLGETLEHLEQPQQDQAQ